MHTPLKQVDVYVMFHRLRLNFEGIFQIDLEFQEPYNKGLKQGLSWVFSTKFANSYVPVLWYTNRLS